MYIIQITNIVKSYFCTAAKRHDAKNLSLSSFLRNKKTLITVAPSSHCIWPTCCVAYMLTYSHHWIVIHLLSSSIQAAVVKLGRLVHPWRLCAQSDPICKKNLYQYKFTDTLSPYLLHTL